MHSVKSQHAGRSVVLGLLYSYWLYGFHYCGCQYKRHDKRNDTVGLISLLMAQVFKVLVDKTTSMVPMNLLVHFLKHGKRWRYADVGSVTIR
jgi:hypothetical protein